MTLSELVETCGHIGLITATVRGTKHSEYERVSERYAVFSEQRDDVAKSKRELEKIIVQDDAAWIPLFSRLRYYCTSERLKGIQSSWNGSVKNMYREMSIAGGL